MIKNKFGKIVSITSRVRWSRDQKYYDQAKWRGTWKLDGGALANQGIMGFFKGNLAGILNLYVIILPFFIKII